MLPELFYKASLIDLKSASYLDYLQWVTVRSSHRRRSIKTGVLKISKNSQENTCARVSFLIKLQEACNLIKIETLAQVFSCEFCEKSLKTPFLQNTSRRLLLTLPNEQRLFGVNIKDSELWTLFMRLYGELCEPWMSFACVLTEKIH